MDNYVFLDLGSSVAAQYVFEDCKKLPNVKYITIFNREISKLETGLISRYCLNIRPFCLLPIDRWLKKLYSLSFCDISSGSFIVFFDAYLSFFSEKYLNDLLSKGYKLCLLFLNSLKSDTLKNIGGGKLKLFKNRIFSFDQYDCIQSGFHYVDCFYSKLVNSSPINKTDMCGVYYLGAAKGRLNKILEFSEAFSRNGIIHDFNIVTGTQNSLISDGSVKYYESAIPYTSALNQMLRYNTILDVVESGQHGATLRYYEAVVYNKKLITTNKFVENLPFYNPSFIQIVDDVSQLDIDWIRSNIAVDYKYDGSFSPVNFLSMISKNG